MRDYKNYFTLSAPPEQVFTTLTNPATIQLWTGEPAEMSLIEGSEFSLWNGSITGKNIAFIPGKKIVQEWDFGDQPEPSVVTIMIHQHKQGSSVELRHTNIPDDDYEDIIEGWNVNYFGSLNDFFD